MDDSGRYQSGDSKWSSYNPFKLATVPGATFADPSQFQLYQHSGTTFDRTKRFHGPSRRSVGKKKVVMAPIKRNPYSTPRSTPAKKPRPAPKPTAKNSIGRLTFAPSVAKVVRYTNRSGVQRKKVVFKKKGKKGKQPDYLKDGSVYQYETGGTVSGIKTVYVGVGSAMNRVRESVFRALMLKSLRKAGVQFNNWDDTPAFKWRFTVKFRQIQSEPPTYSSFDYEQGTGTSYDTAARGLSVNFISAMSIYADLEAIQFYEMRAECDDTNSIDNWTTSSVIQLSDVKFQFNEHHNINIQNQTTADTLASESTDVVSTNPLMYKSYEFHGNGARTSDCGSVNAATLLADGETGNIQLGYTSGAANYSKSLWVLPYKSAFKNCKSVGPKGVLPPGDFCTHKVSRSYTMSIYDLFDNFAQVARSSNTSVVPKIGASVIVAFEKALDTRLSPEKNVTVGFQHKMNVECLCLMGAAKKKTRIVEEATSPAT